MPEQTEHNTNPVAVPVARTQTSPTGPAFARRGPLLRYGVSILLAIASIFVVWVAIPWLGRNAPFAPLMFVVIASGYLCGPGPAFTVTILGALLIDWLFLGQHYSLFQNPLADNVRLIIFLAIGSTISWISGKWHRSAAELADREFKLRVLLDRMPVLLWSTDAHLLLTSSSSAAVHYLFDKAAETLGPQHAPAGEAFFQIDARDFLPIAAQRRALAGEAVSYELPCGQRHFQVHVEPLRNAAKAITGTFGMAWDITEQHRAEHLSREYQTDLESRVSQRTDELARANLVLMQQIAERKRAERELREVSQHARCILWHGEVSLPDDPAAANVDDRGLSWNIRVSDEQSAQQILPLDVPQGAPYIEAFQRSRDPADEAATHQRAKDAVLGGADGYSGEFRCRDRTGAERWLLETVSIQRRGPGRWYLVGVCTDITERKAAQAQREQLLMERAGRAEAEAQSHAKDQFLAVLSHELRTPMTPVLMTISAMEADERLPEDVRSQVRMIRRNIELEARLIDDLLDLTRVSTGKLELAVREIDAHSPLMHARDVCMPDVLAKRLHVELHATAERSFVRADATRLQQVFWNLIRNAVKFTHEGGQINIRTHNDAAGRLVIEIQDSGVGIDPAVLPRIFHAFEQGGRETTRKFGGLGLGLAISKALVELHGGEIGVASEGPGRGATFSVSLATVEAVLPESSSAPAHGGEVTPLRILLVEDHADTRRATARLLRLMGHDVSTADCVAAGLQAAESRLEQDESRFNAQSSDTPSPFDLVISDIGLPDGSGLDLMRQLKCRYRLKGIALSGYGMEQDIRNSRDAGFDIHLTKPVPLEQLEAAIRQMSDKGVRA